MKKWSLQDQGDRTSSSQSWKKGSNETKSVTASLHLGGMVKWGHRRRVKEMSDLEQM